MKKYYGEEGKMKETIFKGEVDFEQLSFQGDADADYSQHGIWYQIGMYEGKEYEVTFDFSEIYDEVEDAGDLPFTEDFVLKITEV